MLPKKLKLPIQEFLGKKGRIVKSAYFSVKIFAPAAKVSRFGVTVSLKVSKKASERNRLRRLVYSLTGEYYNRIPAGDYWITILPPAATADKKTLEADLKHLFYGSFF